MPRVLFCTQTANPRGGVETWLEQLVAVLESRGWEPVVGLARGRVFHRPDVYREHHPQLQTVELDGRTGTREGRVQSLLRAFEHVRPDVIVPVNLVDVLEAVARWKLSGHDGRLVAALHGLQPGSLLDLGRYHGFVDAAVTPARLLLELLVERAGLDPDRCHHVPAGCALPKHARRRRVPGEPLRLGYVGRLEDEEKRISDLCAFVEALEALGVEHTLSIAGSGSREPYLRMRLQAGVLGGRVRFLGWCTNDELYAQVYPALDAILLFSAAEAGPIALWEAMLHGVVPISSRYLGAASERALQHRETSLLFDVGDVLAAAQAAQELAADVPLSERLSRAAALLARQRHGSQAYADDWMTAFATARQGSQAVANLPNSARVPSGLLERLALPPRVSAWIRAALLRPTVAHDPGAEWPHCGFWPDMALAEIVRHARFLDERLGGGASPWSSGPPNGP